MKSKTKIFTAVVTVIGLAAGGSVLATGWDKAGHGGKHSERMLGRIANHLSLDEGQQEALTALSVEIGEAREIMQGNGDLRGDMKDLMAGESFDQATALELINQRTSAIELQAPDIVSAAAVFFDGLSAEQKTELTDWMEKRGRGRFRH